MLKKTATVTLAALALAGCTMLGPPIITLTVVTDNPESVIGLSMEGAAADFALTYNSGFVPVGERQAWTARSIGAGIDVITTKPFADEPYRVSIYRRIDLSFRTVKIAQYVEQLCRGIRTIDPSIRISVNATKDDSLGKAAIASCST